MLPELPPEARRPGLPLLPVTATPREPTRRERRHAVAHMNKVIAGVDTAPAGGRNDALNHAAWTLGHWVAAGALEQSDVEDALYAAAVANGLVADDSECAVQLHRHRSLFTFIVTHPRGSCSAGQ